MSFKICVFAETEMSYQTCFSKIPDNKKSDVIFCHSQKQTRADMIIAYQDQWILFIDADCEVTKEILIKVQTVSELESKNHVYSGQYLNPSAATYLQQAHNFIANTWVQANFYVNKPVFLGGAFLIFSDNLAVLELKKNISEQVQTRFWGAEDKWLSQILLKSGFRFKYAKWLLVSHQTSTKWSHFFRRAFLQGYNDSTAETVFESKLIQFKKANYWFLKLVSTNWLFHPAIGLHFFVLMTGKLVRQIRPLNNLKPLL